MSDKKLLELAAKAAGLSYAQVEDIWNPLTDDGDALRLAVKLGIAVVPYPIYKKPKHSVIAKQYNKAAYLRGEGQDINIEELQVYRDDPYAATRRAIVRAAAETGKNVP